MFTSTARTSFTGYCSSALRGLAEMSLCRTRTITHKIKHRKQFHPLSKKYGIDFSGIPVDLLYLIKVRKRQAIVALPGYFTAYEPNGPRYLKLKPIKQLLYYIKCASFNE
jgi:hypothetical protein